MLAAVKDREQKIKELLPDPGIKVEPSNSVSQKAHLILSLEHAIASSGLEVIRLYNDTKAVDEIKTPLNGGKYPETHSRLLSEAYLKGLPPGELQLMLNEMYARYQAKFETKRLRDLFARSMRGYAPLRSQSQARALFNKSERQNFKRIQKVKSEIEEDGVVTEPSTTGSTSSAEPKLKPGEVRILACKANGQPANPRCPVTEFKILKKGGVPPPCVLH